MTEIETERFRREAEEARRRASMALGLPDKEAWLRIAGEWTRLAQAAEHKLGADEVDDAMDRIVDEQARPKPSR